MAASDKRSSVMLRVTRKAKENLRLYAIKRSHELGRVVSSNKAAEELFLNAPVGRKRRSAAA